MPETFGIGITGVGKYLPKQRVESASLAERLGVSTDWIQGRTGIVSRHFVSDGESASTISASAAQQALERAKISADQINLVIGCTSSGDYLFPAMACKVQDMIGASQAAAFDLNASSVGFQVGLSLAADRLRCDASLQHALVIGTAVQSPYIDWTNPKISILLGDGAAAAVLSRVPEGYGILASENLSNGEIFEAARLRGGGSSFPLRSGNVEKGLQFIEMDGVVMGREFLKKQPAIIEKCLEKAGLRMKDVDLFLFHQANVRLIQFLMDRMKLPMSKTFTNAERLGNTADASLPLALCEASEKGLIKRNDIVVLSGIGAGCLLGATVLRWY